MSVGISSAVDHVNPAGSKIGIDLSFQPTFYVGWRSTDYDRQYHGLMDEAMGSSSDGSERWANVARKFTEGSLLKVSSKVIKRFVETCPDEAAVDLFWSGAVRGAVKEFRERQSEWREALATKKRCPIAGQRLAFVALTAARMTGSFPEYYLEFTSWRVLPLEFHEDVNALRKIFNVDSFRDYDEPSEVQAQPEPVAVSMNGNDGDNGHVIDDPQSLPGFITGKEADGAPAEDDGTFLVHDGEEFESEFEPIGQEAGGANPNGKSKKALKKAQRRARADRLGQPRPNPKNKNGYKGT